DFWFEPSPFWRVVERAALILVAVIPLWVALFDNWRQLLGYTVSSSERYKSDIFATSLTPEPIRWVTFALIAVSLVCLALIYARRQHGLGMLSLMLVFALAYFFFLNSFRMRADVFIVTTQNDLDNPGLASTIYILVWVVTLCGFIASIIAAAYMWLFAVIAFPLHIIFGLLGRNKADMEPESIIGYLRLRPMMTEPPPPPTDDPSARRP
ncbi:MAG TPA: hypothetical protein VHA53_07505, partial [Nitrolancea sp.]|nr:hypothetical protein [Nitrolancea sp.]